MKVEPQIIEMSRKLLVGIKQSMSVSDNRTVDLWRHFMSRQNQIPHRSNRDFISLQEFDSNYFEHFDPDRTFTKWAAVQVTHFGSIPEGMEKLELEEGKYAVFLYKGPAGNPAIFNYIYAEWLPHSDYLLDQRPHFEILGENYKQDSPDSEEEIWIPVKRRS